MTRHQLVVSLLSQLSLLTLLIQSLSTSSEVHAEPYVRWTGNSPIESQITALPPTVIRPKLSFQTRISQATLPILEGLFYKVIVRYKGLLSEGDCLEEFENVRVLDSVLNLELGLNARCDFATAIAQKSEISLKICFSMPQDPVADNGVDRAPEDRCFNREVEISSVPYAVRVERALEAQSVHQANYSFISSYVYRVVDQGVNWTGSTIPPYLSFQTRPPSGLGLDVLGLDSQNTAAIEELSEAGYIRWHPSAGGGGADFFIARSPFGFLSSLVLGARLVDWYGPRDASSTTTDLSALQEGTDGVSLAVRGDMSIEGDLEVSKGRTVVQREATISNGLSVQKGGLYADGEVELNHGLIVQGKLTQGWRMSTLSTTSPTPSYLFASSGPIEFIGSLTLSILSQPAQQDSSSSLIVSGQTTITGPADWSAISTDLSSEAPQTTIAGEALVFGRMDINTGSLDVHQDLKIEGDLEVYEDLVMGSTLSIVRGGSTQPVIEISDEQIAINHPIGDEEGAPYFDEIHFKGNVQFSDRVTLDQPIAGMEAECEIHPARIKKAGPDFGKLIPEVFDLTCGGVTIRVSALLESDCGNGEREGEEICDDGPDNRLEGLETYCDRTSTPFPNCQFFRTLDWPNEADCSSPNIPDVFTARHFNGKCAIQSDTDNEQASISFCLGGGANCEIAQIDYPDMYCRADCSFARCGDGVLDKLAGEICDDGNFVDNDDCDNFCKLVTNCKLKVVERTSENSSLILVNTALTPEDLVDPDDPQAPAPDPTTEEGRSQLRQFFSNAECVLGTGVVSHPEAPQRVVEIDLERPTWLSLETYPYTLEDLQAHSDPFIYVREVCDQVRSDLCDDDGGVGYMSALPPRLYSAGRHYVVVGGYGARAGATYLGVKRTCAQPEKLFASLHHKATDSAQARVFQVNTAEIGRVGHVQTECLASRPEDFIQPVDPAFDPSTARSGLGLRQVALELVLEVESRVSVSADSQSIDPVLYIKGGCEEIETLRDPNDPTQLLCNDNATGNPLFPLAQIDQVMKPGIYYIIVDSDSLVGGLVNISLNVQ